MPTLGNEWASREQLTLMLDEMSIELTYRGFDCPLAARCEGSTVELCPWSCARHFEALRRHVSCAGDSPTLDAHGYASEVLECSGVERTEAATWLTSLALWWAAGVAPDDVADPIPALGTDWLELGDGVEVLLRPWHWAVKVAAKERYLEHDRSAFDPVGYLLELVTVSAVALRVSGRVGALELELLDARATRRLLSAVVALNAAASAGPTLRLAPRGLPARRSSRLGEQPDAVVILFEDDDAISEGEGG